MRQLRTIIIEIIIVLFFGIPASTSAWEACTPDYAAMGPAWLDNVTMDDVYSNIWCSSPDPSAIALSYATSLRLGVLNDYWTWRYAVDGGNVCLPMTYANRLFNAAAFMEEMWANRGSITLPGQNVRSRWLSDFIYPHTTGYGPTCRLDAIATNPGDDGPIQLHLIFFWQWNVAQRGGTLVHENTHEFVGHCPDYFCAAGGSCDWQFFSLNPPGFPCGGGDMFNAQTNNIFYLGEAVDTYRRDPTDPSRLLVVNMGNVSGGPVSDEVCGYLPMLSPAARLRVVNTIQNKLLLNFYHPTPESQFPVYARFRLSIDPLYFYGGLEYDVDRIWNARWECGHICDPVDYDFAAGGRYACNEDFQPGNAERNIERRARCESVEAQIADGVTREEWDGLKASFGPTEDPFGSPSCIKGYAEEYLDAYCDQLGASASNVHDISSQWNLPDFSGYVDTEGDIHNCEWKYCADQFDLQWLTDAQASCFEWSDGNPPDCMTSICGNLPLIQYIYGNNSPEYFEAVLCRKTMLEGFMQDIPPAVTTGPCDEGYQACRRDQMYNQWLDARLQGICSLAPAGQATTFSVDISPIITIHPIIALPSLVLDSIRDLDYETFQDFFPGVTVDHCEAQLSLCEAMEEKGASIVAHFVAVSDVPEKLLLPNVQPEGLPIDILLPIVDANVRRLAEVIVNQPDDAGLTPEEAIRRMTAIPEAQHSLSNTLGKDAYFAIFGVEGRLPIFGSEVVQQYVEPELQFDFSLNPAQELLLPALIEVSEARQRISSPETILLIEQAGAIAEQPAFYNFIHSVANATDTQEINSILDSLPQLIQ